MIGVILERKWFNPKNKERFKQDAIALKKNMKKHFSDQIKNKDTIAHKRARNHVKYTSIVTASDHKKADRNDRKLSLYKSIRKGMVKDKFKKLLRLK